MTCSECIEVLSARLDGEDTPGEGAAADAHLAGCPGCRLWADRAARVTRIARTNPVEPSPDLLGAVLAAAPPRRSAWVRLTEALGDRGVPGAKTAPRVQAAVRVLLAGAGLGQLWLAVGGVVIAAGGAHDRVELGGANLEHLTHESAAWNVALAVGFLWAAVRHRRAAALVPLVGAFVMMLAALSLPDLIQGEVEWSREAVHGVAMIGLLALLALGRFSGRPEAGTPVVLTPDTGGSQESPQTGDVPDVRGMDVDRDLGSTGEHRAA